MLLYVWLLFGVGKLVARNVQLTHKESLVRVAMDYSTHGGIINFVEGVELRCWMGNVDGRFERDELASDGVVQGIRPVDDAQYMR